MNIKGQPTKPIPVGTRFTRLTTTSELYPPTSPKSRAYIVDVVCDCGKRTFGVWPKHLRSGRTKSCGCLQREQAQKLGEISFDGLRGSKSYRWRGIDYPRRLDYWKETLTAIQSGNCAWPLCATPLSQGGQVSVDHWHGCCDIRIKSLPQSKACRKCIRGAVHQRCNIAIGRLEGFMRDGVVKVIDLRVIDYLESCRPVSDYLEMDRVA